MKKKEGLIKKKKKELTKVLKKENKDLYALDEVKLTKFEKNHRSIVETLYNLCVKTERSRFPTLQEIADASGVSTVTVQNHMRKIKEDVKDNAELIEKMKFFREGITMSLVRMAAKGIPSSQRLYYEMIGMLDQQQNVTNNNTVNAINISLTEDE
jgi:hypothetical protein